MIKRMFMFFGLSCLLLSGCRTPARTASEPDTSASTGYASEEVQRISVFYDGSLYLYNATGFDLPREDGWQFLGNVASVNNLEWPAEDFCGTHLKPGQEIYYDPEEPKKLYVKYDRGFALFEAEENAETENTGTLGTGVSEHQGTENPSAGESEDDGAGKTIQAESEAGLLPGVTMEIMDVTETGITVSLVNHTELNMEFGEEYSLEVWNGTGWEAVPYEDGQWAFHSIAYSMPENQPVEWKADWEALYGTLEPGQYRLVKPVMDFRGPGDFTEYGLTAEFELPVQALQEPPVLRLQDSLSSTLAELQLEPENYTWHCKRGAGGEMQGITACGAASTEAFPQQDPLELTQYQGMEGVLYTVSCTVVPDWMNIKEYSRADMGKADAEPVSETILEAGELLELKPDRMYEILAEWDSGRGDARGFYGEACYLVVTE